MWGKDNLDVNQPLHSMKRQSPSDCVDNVLKLMNRYQSIKLLDIRLKELNNKKNAIRNAFKEDLIPKITKTQYKNNIIEVTKINSEIEDIKKNLARYAISIREIINRELSELRAKKDSLLKEKSKVDSRLVRVRNDLSQNKFVKSHTFSSLINFFPDVDIDKLTEVEEFHNKISTILKQELRQSESELAHMMDELNVAINDIDSKLYRSLSNVDNSEVIVDRVHDLAIKYSAIDQEIRYFEAGDKLSGEHTEAKDELAKEKLRVLKITENIINDKLRQNINKIYPIVKRRMPELTLAQNSYTYSASEDTGTGKAYSNLILFDLALFEITSLPIVIHDSILYKNVENSAVAEFIKLYISIGKQSFISIDEISKYGDDVKKTILEKQVLKLSDDLLLYIKDWRKEGSSKP